MYYILKNRPLFKHKKSCYSIKLQRFFSLTFSSFAKFTVSFTLMVFKNAKEKSVEQKDAGLIFANFPSIRKLKFQIFQVTTLLDAFLTHVIQFFDL